MSGGMKALGEASRLTVQSDVRSEASVSPFGNAAFLWMAQQVDFVSPWWSWQRDQDLLRVVGECDVLAGALYAYTSKLAALPFRIEPVDPAVRSHWKLAAQYEALLYECSDFYAGWEEMATKWFFARATQDNGAFLEIIGAGPKNGEIKGPAVGVAFLDPSRCTRTGNPEYPVVYTDVDGRQYSFNSSVGIRWVQRLSSLPAGFDAQAVSIPLSEFAGFRVMIPGGAKWH